MEYPYSDNHMKFDTDRQQYVLTKDYVLNNIYLDEQIETELENSNKFNQLLREVSDDVYLYIMRFTRQDMKQVKKYMLAKSPQYRDVVKRALLYQTRYALRSGAIVLKDMHGVDIEKTRSISLEQIRGDVSISEQARQVLLDAGLLYTGRLNIRISDW